VHRDTRDIHREGHVGTDEPRRQAKGGSSLANTLTWDFSLQNCEEVFLTSYATQSVVFSYGGLGASTKSESFPCVLLTARPCLLPYFDKGSKVCREALTI
jgi:hypothetical protein